MASKTKKPLPEPVKTRTPEEEITFQMKRLTEINTEIDDCLTSLTEAQENREDEHADEWEKAIELQNHIEGLDQIYYKANNLLDETVMQAFGVLLAENSNNGVLDLLQAVAGKKNLNEITDTIKAFY